MPVIFPATFPWSFGDSAEPAEDLRAIEGTSLEWVEDHCEEGKALLISQFRDKPRIEGVLCALLDGVQDLHNAIWQVLTERGIDSATGFQLLQLGTIVGLPNTGWGDETYRTLLRAQVLTLRSKGRWQDIAKILAALGITLTLTHFDEPGMAAMRVTLGEPMDGDVTAEDVFNFIVRAKPAGVRFVLEFPVEELAETFTWADGDTADTDALRGWADDGETLGGYWAGELATTEST